MSSTNYSVGSILQQQQLRALPEIALWHMRDLSFGTGIFPIHSCIRSEYLLVRVTAKEDSLPNVMAEAVRDQS